MKNSILFIIILIIAIAGGAALFVFESRLPNNELINRDVNSQLLKVDTQDANINELALRSRASLDTNYDMLVRSTGALERTISELSNSYFNKEMIAGSLLDKRFEKFKDSMEVKIDQIENFKSSNAVLRNSEKYIPIVGIELSAQAKQSGLPELAEAYKQIVIDMLEFTKQGNGKLTQEVANLRQRVMETENIMPAQSSIKVFEFANHIATAIDSKQKTDQYLDKVLNSATDDQIGAISNAWSLWQSEHQNSGENLRTYTVAYLLSILALVGVLTYRLRRLYSSLDRKLEEQGLQAKMAYQKLRSSEKKLAQSEKMASLGQLVAGVAHEINTPLGYVSSNMDTIKSRLERLLPVFVKADAISTMISNPDRDPREINRLLKEQIAAYRGAGNNNTPENLAELLSDSSEGLQEIKSIVDTLTNFTHVQNTPPEEVDINERINAALKVSAKVIGKRKISTELQDDLPAISGVPNQLSQVFTNIINNAVQATNADVGTLAITSRLVGESIEITFSDDGQGIDEELLPRVFEPFFTTKEVGEGTGLGLSIAHRIVTAHGGELSIESDAGTNMGTKVTLLLPTSSNIEATSLLS